MPIVSIPLTQGKFALIDEADYAFISQFKWFAYRAARKNNPDVFYAARVLNQKRIPMHRFILSPPDDVDVDHENGNTLDNRRSNLRFATDSQNQANRHALNPQKSSRFRGVTYHRNSGRWQAQIKIENKGIYLGLFSNEVDAARAYDEAALIAFGEFSLLNFGDAA